MKQTWDAASYASNARFVSDLGAPLLDLLHPQAGERILDIGCGDGALTQKLVDAGAVVVGVDASESMIAAARNRGLDAHVADAHSLTFNQEFDAVFSNAALHWMLRPDDVIAGVARALRPGGRFVAEFGGHLNIAAICTAIRAVLTKHSLPINWPWYYPTPAEYSRKLEAQGFNVDYAALIPRPTPLPTGMRGWLETFAKPLLGAAPTNVIAEVEDLLRPALCDPEGNWTADYVRIRVKATLK